MKNFKTIFLWLILYSQCTLRTNSTSNPRDSGHSSESELDEFFRSASKENPSKPDRPPSPPNMWVTLYGILLATVGVAFTLLETVFK